MVPLIFHEFAFSRSSQSSDTYLVQVSFFCTCSSGKNYVKRYSYISPIHCIVRGYYRGLVSCRIDLTLPYSFLFCVSSSTELPGVWFLAALILKVAVGNFEVQEPRVEVSSDLISFPQALYLNLKERGGGCLYLNLKERRGAVSI